MPVLALILNNFEGFEPLLRGFSWQRRIKFSYIGFCQYRIICPFQWTWYVKRILLVIYWCRTNNFRFWLAQELEESHGSSCQTKVLLDFPAEPCSASAMLVRKRVGNSSSHICTATSLGSENCCFFKGLKLSSSDLHQNSSEVLKSCCFSCLGLQREANLFAWISQN